MEKKTKIYGMSRRDPTLSGKLSSSLKDDAWTEEGGVWDGLGLSKWDYAEATELAKYATGRRFKNYIEEAHDGAISNQKTEHGAQNSRWSVKKKCQRLPRRGAESTPRPQGRWVSYARRHALPVCGSDNPRRFNFSPCRVLKMGGNARVAQERRQGREG